MDKCIMVGCDLHDRNMLLKIAVGADKPITRSWANRSAGRAAMIADLKRRAAEAGVRRIVFAYEACGLGYVVYDELTAAGIECYILAPTRMEKSLKHIRGKTDERDAQDILERLRGWLLAGNTLPSIWVPDRQTRDDRELVRMRLDAADKKTRVKIQIRWLLKRHGIENAPADSWTTAFYAWLNQLAGSVLPAGASAALASLLRQLDWSEQELDRLDKQVLALSRAQRYREPMAALYRQQGVGVLTAMVFLTEMGDLSRFANRYQVGSFLGLTPSSNETGESDDRKGHITRQGPGRVRKVLNQAVWSRVREGGPDYPKYQRLVARNPKHKKIAIVALMRELAVILWHVGLEAQQRAKSQAA
jgi:transposase